MLSSEDSSLSAQWPPHTRAEAQRLGCEEGAMVAERMLPMLAKVQRSTLARKAWERGNQMPWEPAAHADCSAGVLLTAEAVHARSHRLLGLIEGTLME